MNNSILPNSSDDNYELTLAKTSKYLITESESPAVWATYELPTVEKVASVLISVKFQREYDGY